jgi:hypothetical protein
MIILPPIPDAERACVESDCFGSSPQDDIRAPDSGPRVGQLVVIEFRGEQRIARYRGRYVDLLNGTDTWTYKLLRVQNLDRKTV